MIPVLICPVVSRFDLLEDLLVGIDHGIERLVIVDNSLTDYEVPFDLPLVDSVLYIRPLIGLGYPGGINAAITQTPFAPWWMWASNDLRFAPHDLAHIDGMMANAKGPRHITGSHRGLRNVYGAMNRETVDQVGLFDEWSFFPIYYDDDDFERRCHLGDVEWVTYDGQMTHAGSQTINSDAAAARANNITFQENSRRYVAKWGGLPGSETYSTPWNEGHPLAYYPVDIAGRHRRMW